jgi:hypothetical protein
MLVTCTARTSGPSGNTPVGFAPEATIKLSYGTSLDTSINFYELEGTVTIANGVVTGVDTAFSADLDEGDIVFVVYQDESQNPDPDPLPIRMREFRVTSFDSTAPATKMNVTPTNISVGAGAYMYKSQSQEIKKTINSILDALKNLNFVQ